MLTGLLPHRSLATWPLLVLGLALWLITHPYRGIMGDARFYNLQFLHALHPAAYAAELYFQFGSQDDFSAFTPVFAPVIALLGLNAGNILLNIAFQGLWLGGLWCFLTALAQSPTARAVAFTAAITLRGGVNFVHYGEPLLTPRLLAEGLSLWALGTMLRGQPARAALWLALAFVFHPLMALPPLAVFLLDVAQKRPASLLALPLGAALSAGLAWYGVPPFTRLAAVYDPAWFAPVNTRDGFCLISNWDFADWIPVYTTAVLACVSLAFARAAERRLLAMALAVAGAGLAISYVGADLLHLVLVTQAQLWRAVSLLSLVANVSFGLTLLRLWLDAPPSSGSRVDASILLLAFAAASLVAARFLPAFIALTAPAAAIGGMAARWRQRANAVPGRSLVSCPRSSSLLATDVGDEQATGNKARVSRTAPHLDAASFGIGTLEAALLVALATAFVFAATAIAPSLHSLATTPTGVWPTLCRLFTAALGAAGLVALASPAEVEWLRTARRWIRKAALPLLAAAVLLWDARTPWSHFIETSAEPPASLAKLLPSNAAVYWEGDVKVPWFLLHRPSLSCEQGTGVLFNRGTALAYQARYSHISGLGTLDYGLSPDCHGTRDHQAPPLSQTEIRALCLQEPELDALVLAATVEGDPGSVWTPPVPFEASAWAGGERYLAIVNSFHIYRCAGRFGSPELAGAR